MPVVSTIRTRYSAMENDEFLQEIEQVRHHSPIIQELCRRLEEDILAGGKEINHLADCPVCQAQLNIDFDTGNNRFIVNIAE